MNSPICTKHSKAWPAETGYLTGAEWALAGALLESKGRTRLAACAWRGHSCGVTADKTECQQNPTGMPAQREESKVGYKTWCGQIRFSTCAPTGIASPDKKQGVPVTLEFQISNEYASTQGYTQSNIYDFVSFSPNQLEPECQGVSSLLLP